MQKFGLSSAALIAAPAIIGDKASAQDAGHDHEQITGPLANATVSFGAWHTDPPVDRFPNLSPIPANAHKLVPFRTKIRAGGTVNFIISGFHHVLVYGPGTQPEDIKTDTTIPTTGTPPGLPLINDPTNRVYRGLDPSTQTLDRVEVVEFANPGQYLVICGFLPHFLDGMFGYVQVVGSRKSGRG